MLRRQLAPTGGFRSLGPLLLAGVFLSCSPSAPPRSVPGGKGDDGLILPEDRVAQVDNPDRPTLRLVRREGDPAATVAVAVFPPGGSRGALGITALIETRLAQARLAPSRVRPHALGVVIANEITDADAAARFVTAVYEALSNQVASGEPAVERATDLLRTLGATAGEPSGYGHCLGALAADGQEALQAGSPFTNDELEQLRLASFASGRVGISALGSQEILKAVTQAHDQTWPAGAPPDGFWPKESEVAVLSGPSTELRIAIRAQDQEAALAAARALSKKRHLARARLHGIDPELHIAEVNTTLHPTGACLGVTVVHDDESHPPSADDLASAAVALRDELHTALADSQSENQTTLALLSPEGALEAASLAAWTAVRGAKKDADAARPWSVIEVLATPKTRPKAAEFNQLLQDAVAAAGAVSQEFSFAHQNEGGQAESWLLVASTCGTAPEPPEEAGLRALTITSLASDFSGRAGVTLEPYITTDAVGLLAHGAPLRGESPDHHAARLARAVAQALAGDAVDGRDVASARAAQLESVGNDSGRDRLIEILSGGSASWLQPSGIERSVAPLSSADVERARGQIAREPLQAAMLASSTRGQSGAAERALHAWLAPMRKSVAACPTPERTLAAAGQWTVETLDGNPGIHLGVPTAGDSVSGALTAYLLSRPGGYLESALAGAEVTGSAHGSFLSSRAGGALLIELRAEPSAEEAATGQVRAALDELAHGQASEADLKDALAAFEVALKKTSRTPRGRLLQLFESVTRASLASPEAQGGPSKAAQPTRSSPAKLKKFQESLGEKAHRIVVVKVRK